MSEGDIVGVSATMKPNNRWKYSQGTHRNKSLVEKSFFHEVTSTNVKKIFIRIVKITTYRPLGNYELKMPVGNYELK